MKVAWVHNFRLPVKQQARYVAVQIAHKKQFVVSDEMAVVKGAADLPLFKPDAAKRIELVTEGVAFIPVWGNVQPICQNLPLRSRLQKQDARIGDRFDKPCKIVLDLPDTLKFMTTGIEPTDVTHDGRRFKRYLPLNDGLFAFDNTYPDLLQLAMPSLYVAGNPLAVAENISANRARMKTNDNIPWLSTGCYGEYDPRRTRDMILEAFANGSRGVTYYWYGHFDAGHFLSHAEAINIVTPIEDIFMDGAPLTDLKVNHDKLKVCGMGLVAGASAELAVLVSNYQGVPLGTNVSVVADQHVVVRAGVQHVGEFAAN